MSKIVLSSLESVTLAEADAYLAAADGDEILAAYSLAADRNVLDGSADPPDDTEVHHALFLLRKVRGQEAPSYDDTCYEQRRRVAA
jgi:hypothetical protein